MLLVLILLSIDTLAVNLLRTAARNFIFKHNRDDYVIMIVNAAGQSKLSSSVDSTVV